MLSAEIINSTLLVGPTLSTSPNHSLSLLLYSIFPKGSILIYGLLLESYVSCRLVVFVKVTVTKPCPIFTVAPMPVKLLGSMAMLGAYLSRIQFYFYRSTTQHFGLMIHLSQLDICLCK